MHENPPMLIDPVAARRWSHRRSGVLPWLHEEVARRMTERLDWIRIPVQRWAHWEPEPGAQAAIQALAQHHPQANRVDLLAQGRAPLAAGPQARWWQRLGRGRAPDAPQVLAELPERSVQLVWSNMLAHQVADPRSLIQAWHAALDLDGFLMFSCFGPDTLRELRALYAALGWPPPAHEFTDMHDWGDRLIEAGFADPVMDMEHITLTFDTPARLLDELRELGRNLHPQRFAGLRTPAWRHRLEQAMDTQLRPDAQAPLALSFEIVYGHALRPQPRPPRQYHRRRAQPPGPP